MPGADQAVGRWWRPRSASVALSAAREPARAVVVDDAVGRDRRSPVNALTELLGRVPVIDRTPGVWWPSRWDGAIVAVLVAFAALLRLPNIGRAYWVDEGISVGIASHPMSQIPHLLRLDGSPPLFYIMLHEWIRAFGPSQVSTHVLALLISLTVIPLAFWAGRTLFGRTAGIAAAALSADNPFLNWYATETRMYAMLCALGLVAATFVIRAVRRRSRGDAAIAVVAFAALLYTHNWALYLMAATGVVLFVRVWRVQDRSMARAVIVCAVAVGVLYLPWLPSLLSQIGHTAAPWAVPPGIGDIFADPASMLGGTLGVIVAPLLAYGVWATRSSRPVEDRDGTVILGLSGLATLVVGWLVSQVDPTWTVRYLGVTLGLLILAAAGALSSTPQGRAVIGSVFVICAAWSVIGSVLPNPSGHYAKSNVAAVALAARPYLRPGDVVVVNQTEQLAVLAHYLPPGLVYVTPTGPVADPTVVDWRDLVARLGAADPCFSVIPSVAALPIGARVLEVDPLHPIGASGSTWSRTTNGAVLRVDEALASSGALQPDRSFTEATQPKPFSAVVGELFVKSSGGMACR